MNPTSTDENALPATLSAGELLAGYRARKFTPTTLMEHVLDRVASAAERHVWISLLSRERVLG